VLLIATKLGARPLSPSRTFSQNVLVGASSMAQLDESIAAADLELTADQWARLDTAGLDTAG
jgi:aryl-alcohol dehydrogenase-like predicted oxidoreductase